MQINETKSKQVSKYVSPLELGFACPHCFVNTTEISYNWQRMKSEEHLQSQLISAIVVGQDCECHLAYTVTVGVPSTQIFWHPLNNLSQDHVSDFIG